MASRVDADRAAFIRDIQDEKADYERQLRADPNDKAAKENLRRTNSILRRFGVTIEDGDGKKDTKPGKPGMVKPYYKNPRLTPEEEAKKKKEFQDRNKPKPYRPSEDNKEIPMVLMKDGGMARGKGGKMYQHNYATGGSVQDNLKQPPAGNEGLKKLPKDVRNRMGYMKKGGMVK